MGKISEINKERLIYLAKEFDIFTEKDLKELSIKEVNDLSDSKLSMISYIKNKKSEVLAIKKVVHSEDKKKPNVLVSISEKTFIKMIKADPTEQKANLQWLLTTFRRMIKEDEIDEAIRFADEDLRGANDYLILFEGNKRKKKFIEWSNKNEYRKWKIENPNASEKDWELFGYNPSDINQYKSLSQLYDAVDPFMERITSNLEKAMQKFVNLGEAEIPFRDRKWTIYVPLSMDANVVMNGFASWCTAKPRNGMFESYTNYKTPILGDKSKIYVIINNNLFTGETDECYQIHFESKQIKDRSNSNIDFYGKVISTSEGLANYFHSELDGLARTLGTVDDNLYLDYLISFGFTESLFEFLDEDTPVIRLRKKDIPRLPDMSKFKKLDQLLLLELGMKELHPSIGYLSNLELLSIPNNNIKELPKEIGMLKKLDFINLKGNPLKSIPNEIGELDKTKGGRLCRMSVSVEDIGEENFKKLKKLLPSVLLIDE